MFQSAIILTTVGQGPNPQPHKESLVVHIKINTPTLSYNIIELFPFGALLYFEI